MNMRLHMYIIDILFKLILEKRFIIILFFLFILIIDMYQNHYYVKTIRLHSSR